MQTHCGPSSAGLGLPTLSPVTKSLDPFDLLERIRLRSALSDEIERILAILDELDGDPDLEENGDLEPSICSSCDHGRYDLERDDADDEPSLGSPESAIDHQGLWGRGAQTDCEADDSDAEANGDELDYSDHPSGMDGGLGDLEGFHEQLQGFYGHSVAYQ